MQISRKRFAIAICLTAILCVAIGYSLHQTYTFKKASKARANVFILIESVEGDYVINPRNHITNDGERYVCNLIGFNNITNANATKWVSLGNTGVPLITWTQLQNEVNANGFSRAVGAVVGWMNGTDRAYNVTKKFTATGVQTLNTTGCQWNPRVVSNNNLFACASFTEVTFQINDNCTIKWVITVNCN